MAEGDRLITLIRPGEVTGRSPSGSEILGAATEFRIWAVRQDRGGTEGVRAETLIGSWQVRFEIRWQESIKAVSPSWQLIDEYGREHDIEAVNEAPMARRRWLWIYAVARTTKSQDLGLGA